MTKSGFLARSIPLIFKTPIGESFIWSLLVDHAVFPALSLPLAEMSLNFGFWERQEAI